MIRKAVMQNLDNVELETDGEISGVFDNRGNNYFLNERKTFENETKRKRSESEGSSLNIPVCSDDGRCNSGDSGSSSSNGGTGSGSTGLEETLSDLDLSDEEKTKVGTDRDNGIPLSGSFSGVLALDYNTIRPEIDNSNEKQDFDPLLNAGESIYGPVCVDEDGDTLLHIAIICLIQEFAIGLVRAMDITCLNTLNYMFQTPLHLAILTEQNDIAMALLHRKVCVHLRDQKGRTPFLLACETGNTELLEIMLSKEPCCSFLEENFATKVLTTHCNLPNDEILNITNSDGQGCVHIAATNGDIDTMTLLLSKGADINNPEKKSGRTALHLAAEIGNENMVQCLLSYDTIDYERRTFGDETALAVAYHRKRSNIYDLLVAKGAKLNMKYLAKFGVVTSEIKKRTRTAE